MPPPWLELTTRDPAFSAARVSPPGATRTPAGLDRTKGLRSTWRGDSDPPSSVGAVDSYGETALKLVSDTIRGWDAKTITDRLENAVGDDLQYIRINGTLVGGLVGVLIHAIDIWI